MNPAPLRILLVEDRSEDREEIEKELAHAKVAVDTRSAACREEFLREVREFEPDVVLSDFALPRLDALEALSILRRYRPDVPFILVTGAQSEEVAVECMKRGADDYILKTSLKRLPSAILNAVRKRDVERQMERARLNLEENEAQYRLIAEHTQDLIFVLDRSGRFIYASPSFRGVLGYAPEELTGRAGASLLHPEERAAVRVLFRESLASGVDRTTQVRYRHRDGRWRLFESVLSWARNEAGRPVKGVIVARDIEERRRLEEQVRQAQKMEAVGRLAGGVAHDFNNLLTAINGYSDLLLRSLDRMDPRRADVEEIKDTAARAATLTQQLLAFSRRQITQPTVLDLNKLVGNLEKMLRRLIGEDVRLETDLQEGLYRVRADMGQVEQVLLNLSVNARDAMPRGGLLSISTANVTVRPEDPLAEVPSGRYVRLTVVDTGVGMDPETRAHLFEPFFTTKEVGRGTGLGLSTVYAIVQQAGGHIRVTSEPEKGTGFRIYLPRAEAPGAASARPEEGEETYRGEETILLVEDDRAVRVLAQRVLSQGGYRVLEAPGGEDALRAARAESGPIQILVTDVVLGGMTGPELAERLIADRPALRVLFLSGYMESDAQHSVLSRAGSAFLSKPFRPRDLLRKVRELLDSGAPGETAKKGGGR